MRVCTHLLTEGARGCDGVEGLRGRGGEGVRTATVTELRVYHRCDNLSAQNSINAIGDPLRQSRSRNPLYFSESNPHCKDKLGEFV